MCIRFKSLERRDFLLSFFQPASYPHSNIKVSFYQSLVIGFSHINIFLLDFFLYYFTCGCFFFKRLFFFVFPEIKMNKKAMYRQNDEADMANGMYWTFGIDTIFCFPFPEMCVCVRKPKSRRNILDKFNLIFFYFGAKYWMYYSWFMNIMGQFNFLLYAPFRKTFYRACGRYIKNAAPEKVLHFW